MLNRMMIPVFVIFFLAACQTLSGMEQDMQKLIDSSKTAFSSETGETAKAASKVADADNTPCPPLSLAPNLSEMIEFKNLSKPSAKTETARLRITEVQGICNIRDGNLIMDIAFTFDGSLGPMARVKKTDRPSFAFPYFVAVTGPDGNVLSKEIFAASMMYEANQNTLQLEETITQSMPLATNGNIPSYKIITGFQLTNEQLAYNRREL